MRGALRRLRNRVCGNYGPARLEQGVLQLNSPQRFAEDNIHAGLTARGEFDRAINMAVPTPNEGELKRKAAALSRTVSAAAMIADEQQGRAWQNYAHNDAVEISGDKPRAS